jgi:transposase
MKARSMPELTEEQHSKLVNGYRHTKDVRIRSRAHMVLLACEQHLSAPSSAISVRQDAETVRRWLKRSLKEGSAGLVDRPRTGAPPKTTKAYEEQ